MSVRRSFTDESGRRHFVRGVDAVDAAVKLELLKEKVRKQLLILDESVTVAEWAEDYLDVFIRSSASEGWVSDIERMIRTRILPEVGSMKVRLVREIHLQKILAGAKDMSYSYQTKLVQAIKRLFRTARTNRIISEDPAETLKQPPREDEVIGRALTEEERAAIEDFLPRHRMGLAFALMLYAGLRDQEVIALNKGDIDLERRQITVNKALKREGFVGSTKTRSGARIVPIQDSLISYLEGRLSGHPETPLCPNTAGSRHSRSTFRRGWLNFMRELNIAHGAKTFRLELLEPVPFPDIKPYYLRHTFCVDCEKKGIPVQVTSRIMGHSSISVTLRYYTHDSKKVQDMALAALNGEGWRPSGTLLAHSIDPISPN